jgi:hypothetical protein
VPGLGTLSMSLPTAGRSLAKTATVDATDTPERSAVRTPRRRLPRGPTSDLRAAAHRGFLLSRVSRPHDYATNLEALPTASSDVPCGDGASALPGHGFDSGSRAATLRVVARSSQAQSHGRARRFECRQRAGRRAKITTPSRLHHAPAMVRTVQAVSWADLATREYGHRWRPNSIGKIGRAIFAAPRERNTRARRRADPIVHTLVAEFNGQDVGPRRHEGYKMHEEEKREDLPPRTPRTRSDEQTE